MHRNWKTSLIGISAGLILGAIQVVRENAGSWDATHATPATIVLQTAAGALLGGALLGALMLYWSLRRHPAAPSVTRVSPGAVAPDSVMTRHRDAAGPGARYGVRHVFVLVFGLGLLVLGGIVLVACLRHPTVYGLLRGGFGAVFMLGLGGYLLFDDFVAPHLGSAGGRAA